MGAKVSAADAEQVRQFLLTMKMAVARGRWTLADRDKNLADLVSLGMTRTEVSLVLQSLTVDDYCEGPLADDKGRAKEWWVFGPRYSGETLYVKISLNRRGMVECLSFHRALHSMTYPLRRGREAT